MVFAETYKWEDANGVHYSDNASSVPEKYRAKVLEETRAESKSYTPPGSTGLYQPSNANQNATNQARAELQRKTIEAIRQQQQVINQANLEQQRRVSDVMRQQQANALVQSNKKAEGAMQSLANFIAIWLLVGLGMFISWIFTIVDIVRSDFTTPSNKTVWTILVILLPGLGSFLYFIIGTRQKRNYISYKDMEQAALLARLSPSSPRVKDHIV